MYVHGMRYFNITKYMSSTGIIMNFGRLRDILRNVNVNRKNVNLNRQHNLYTYDAVTCARVTRAGEVASQCRNGATQVRKT